MSVFDHWHPVLKSNQLKSKPIPIILNGKQIVLFRDTEGFIGALDDACPHRRMALSQGFVKNGRLTCIYHGMNFDKDGKGKSPGSDDCKISANKWDVMELNTVIWVKSTGSIAPVPEFDLEGFRLMDIRRYTIYAPIEIVLDNFTEVEHTPDVHAFLGYDPKSMKEVSIEVETEDKYVQIKNIGQQKKLPLLFRYVLGITKSNLFVDEWKSFFSPIYTVYDQYWIDPKTNEKRETSLRIYAFFNPIGEGQTQLFVFAYMKYPLFSHFGLNLLIKPAIKKILDLEVIRDKRILEKILDKDPKISGMKLTRFDRSLGPNRQRIERIYKGFIKS